MRIGRVERIELEADEDNNSFDAILAMCVSAGIGARCIEFNTLNRTIICIE